MKSLYKLKKDELIEILEELQKEIKINYDLATMEEKLAFQTRKEYADGWRGEFYVKYHKAYELNLVRAESLYKKVQDLL